MGPYRWCYWAGTLCLLVWLDMPSGANNTAGARQLANSALVNPGGTVAPTQADRHPGCVNRRHAALTARTVMWTPSDCRIAQKIAARLSMLGLPRAESIR